MNFKKNIFYLFTITFFVSNHAFSQNNSRPNTISSCEVTLIDGTKQQGEITSFLEKSSRIDGNDIWYTSPEKLYNLTDREFTFKSAQCPQFIAKIIKNDKFNKNIYKLSSSENKKKISKVKHDKSLSKREKEMIIDALRLDIDNELYVKLIEDYLATCKS